MAPDRQRRRVDGADRRSGRRPGRRVTPSGLLAVLIGVAVLVAAGPGVAAGALADGAVGQVSDRQERVGAGPIPQTGGDDGSTVQICDRDAETFIDVYNDQVDRVPGLLTDRVRDSNVHLQVEGDDPGDYTMAADEESQVTDYKPGEPANASVRVETDCETFQEISDSDDPGETFRMAYANDQIRIVGLGPVNAAVFAAADLVTEPISILILLIILLVILILLYVFYRRLTLYYRGDDDDEEPDGEPAATAEEGTGDAAQGENGPAAGSGPQTGPPRDQPPAGSDDAGGPPRTGAGDRPGGSPDSPQRDPNDDPDSRGRPQRDPNDDPDSRGRPQRDPNDDRGS